MTALVFEAPKPAPRFTLDATGKPKWLASRGGQWQLQGFDPTEKTSVAVGADAAILQQVGGLSIGPGQVALVVVRFSRNTGNALASNFGVTVNGTVVLSSAAAKLHLITNAAGDNGLAYFYLFPSEAGYGGSLVGMSDTQQGSGAGPFVSGTAFTPAAVINQVGLTGDAGHVATTIRAAGMRVFVMNMDGVGCDEAGGFTSTVAADTELASVTGLNIPANIPVLVLAPVQADWQAGNPVQLGLKVNGTVTFGTASQVLIQNTDTALMAGLVSLVIMPGATSYQRAILNEAGLSDGAGAVKTNSARAQADVSIAAITSITVTGNPGNVLNTVGCQRLRVIPLFPVGSMIAFDPTEKTTIAIGAVTKLSEVTGLSIAPGQLVYVQAKIRKSAGAAAAPKMGLRVNGVDVLSPTDAVIAGQIAFSATNEAESGLLEFYLMPGETNYQNAGTGNFHVSGAAAGNGFVLGVNTAQLPAAAITEIAITGDAVNALITIASKDLKVYVL